ncbi:MAG TPA: flavocytochrome c [Tissierellaceae bacterium]
MKKRNIVLFLVLVLSLTSILTACGNKETAQSAKLKDGTYEGVGAGRGGDIKVKLTSKDGKIENIEVVEHAESPGLDESMDILTEKIVSNNSLNVDTVTGATLTSHGFLSAVKNALENAGVNPKDYMDEIAVASEKEKVEQTHDVVVIGAGGGGFAAAIEAKQAGADVVILEKLPVPGGNTLLSGGEYAAPNNWLQKDDAGDSVELFKEDILNGGDNIANEELVEILAENALAGAEWLRDEINVPFEDELMFFGGHSVMRSLVPKDATGATIINAQRQKAEELGIPLLLNTKATELITDETGRVVGVKAESEDKEYTFTANKGVVLATGGFGSNMEMRKENNKDMDENILSTNSVGSTGDGILMAKEVGADVLDMEHIQTYPVCDPKTGSLLYFGDSRMFGHAILVNQEGERFVEELERRDVISMAIKEQTDHIAYQLIDTFGYEDSRVGEKHEAEMNYLFNQGLLVKADTLEEAAEYFDIDTETFVNTVNTYNEYVKEGEDKDFNKRLLTEPIEKGPFYLMKVKPAVHHTMGGVRINTDAQVLNTNGEVIEGLYASGEVTGGIHGTNRLGSNAIADIIVFGRIAGKNIAK